jgi:hypothetical protein
LVPPKLKIKLFNLLRNNTWKKTLKFMLPADKAD